MKETRLTMPLSWYLIMDVPLPEPTEVPQERVDALRKELDYLNSRPYNWAEMENNCRRRHLQAMFGLPVTIRPTNEPAT